MSAAEKVSMRNGVRVTAAALCRWERTPQGVLRATWRRGSRVAPGACAGGHTPKARMALIREGGQLHAGSRCGGSARQRPIDRWIASGFIAALYLMTFAGIAIVVRA